VDTAAQKRVVRSLLKHAGTTYAEEASIRLKDQPMPLFQLLTLCMLASKPIDATIAMQAARELFGAGVRAPQAARGADRATMIKAFGRVHYVRYDESSATRLADIFLREVQDLWTWTRPHFDKRAVTSARQLGLPTDADKLGALAPRNDAKLAAALVRVSLDDELRDKVSSQQ
jgi:hypothetical protein